MWTKDRRCVVALTFDFDAESSWIDRHTEQGLPTMVSRGQYGANEGVGRILHVLEEYALPATFFVPGYTADHYPQHMERIVAAGHEVGHHGYVHESPLTLDEAAERGMIERGIESLRRHTGVLPLGYRAPSWEMSPRTVPLLLEYGFAYDASMMAWDRPYWIHHDGQRTSLVEVPSDWSLADSTHFMFIPSPTYMSGSADPRAVEVMWQEEFDGLYVDGGCLVLTLHPQFIGRYHRLRMLERLLRYMRGRPNVWFARMGEIAAAFRDTEDGST